MHRHNIFLTVKNARASRAYPGQYIHFAHQTLPCYVSKILEKFWGLDQILEPLVKSMSPIKTPWQGTLSGPNCDRAEFLTIHNGRQFQ